MSRTDAWMPLYIGDYLADTMHLNAQEHGAYLLLLMHYWRNGPLLDDDKVLAGICRTSKTTWERHIATAVRAFFVHENGRLHQKRMDVEREKAAGISAKRREAGSRGGAEKAARVSNEINAPAVANAKQTPSKAVANEWQMPPHAGARASASPSQSQIPKKEEGKKEARAVALAPELPSWLPPEVWTEWTAHRRNIRKPMSDLSAKKLLTSLEALRRDGHDFRQVIDQSIANNWSGFFPVKNRQADRPYRNGFVAVAERLANNEPELHDPDPNPFLTYEACPHVH